MKKSLSFFLFLSVIMISWKSQASHVMGGQITYECLGDEKYKIILTFYRDCGGAPVCDENCECSRLQLEYSSMAGNFWKVITLDPDATQLVDSCKGKEITPVCDLVKTSCDDPSSTVPGAEKYVYSTIITLPGKYDDWKIVSEIPNRNSGITTFKDPLVPLYLEARINNNDGCYSSPVYTEDPIPYICLGEDFHYNPGIRAFRGDSVALSLINPMGSGGQPIIYRGGYNPESPVSSDPPLIFNRLTGDVHMSPKQQEISVISYKIDQYRRGQWVGSTMQDMQVIIYECGNNYPEVSGINNTGDYIIKTCAGQEICFEVFGSDPNEQDILTMEWNKGIAKGTFYVENNKTTSPSGSFCWTPTADDARSAPHLFTVKISDDFCESLGKQYFTYYIYVSNPPDLDLTVSEETVCQGKCVILRALQKNAPSPLKYIWNDANLPNDDGPFEICPESKANYKVTLVDGAGCKASDELTVNVKYVPDIDFEADKKAGCIPVIVDLNAVSSNPAAIESWSWNVGNSVYTDKKTPDLTHTFYNSGSYDVSLSAMAKNGCLINISRPEYIKVHEMPEVDFQLPMNSAYLANEAVTVLNNSVHARLYYWDAGDGAIYQGGQPDMKHIYQKEGEYHIKLIASNQFCSDSALKTIRIFDRLVIGFPNVFTPNGDGLNDQFKPVGTLELIQDATLSIWNRWGEKFFETEDLYSGWNGKYPGNREFSFQNPTYVYMAELTDIFGKRHTYKGTVMLLR